MAKMRSPIFTRSKDFAPSSSKDTGNKTENDSEALTTESDLKAKKKRVASTRSLSISTRCRRQNRNEIPSEGSESESEELMVPVTPRPLKAKKRVAPILSPIFRNSEPQVWNEYAASLLNSSGFTGPAKKKIKVEVVDLISSSSSSCSSSAGESFSDSGNDEQESTTEPNDEPKKDEGPQEVKERLNFLRQTANLLHSMLALVVYVISLLFGGLMALIIAYYFYYLLD